VADLGRGAVHAAPDHLIRIGAPRAQATLQLRHGGRQDEDPDDVGIDLLQLLRALPVDVEQHVAPALDDLQHLGLQRAVAMAEDVRPFEELATGHHFVEFVVRDEIIVLAVDLAGADRPGGGGDGKGQPVVGGHQHARDRGLAGTRRAGQHEEEAPPQDCACDFHGGQWRSEHGLVKGRRRSNIR
jgi:hypothetical protein